MADEPLSDNDALFNFPCDFPIKVMGRAHPDFLDTVAALVEQFDPELDRSRIEVRGSKSGTYTSLTVFVLAQNRGHLDDIYRAITAHPMVSTAL